MVDTQVTDIPFWVILLGGKELKRRASYWRHGNTPLPEKINYNTQCCDGPTFQHFMWGDSPELKLENNKGSESDDLHVRNQVTLNCEKLVWLMSHMWIQSLCCRLTQIYISYLEPMKKIRKKPDVDTMDGNISLRVTQKAFVAHSQILIQWKTSMVASVNHRSHQRYFEILCMIRV